MNEAAALGFEKHSRQRQPGQTKPEQAKLAGHLQQRFHRAGDIEQAVGEIVQQDFIDQIVVAPALTALVISEINADVRQQGEHQNRAQLEHFEQFTPGRVAHGEHRPETEPESKSPGGRADRMDKSHQPGGDHDPGPTLRPLTPGINRKGISTW